MSKDHLSRSQRELKEVEKRRDFYALLLCAAVRELGGEFTLEQEDALTLPEQLESVVNPDGSVTVRIPIKAEKP